MPQFLSDSWFDAVDELRSAAGEIPVPEVIKSLKMNVVITGHPEGDKHVHIAAGDFKRGLTDGAPTKITVPYPVAKAIFIDNDQAAGMQAFMSGQIQIEGDMAVMMQMQAAGPPSAQALALQTKVREITQG